MLLRERRTLRQTERKIFVARAFPKRDVVVGIAASGTTQYVLGALEFARQLGAVTVGVTSNPKSPLARAAQIADNA